MEDQLIQQPLKDTTGHSSYGATVMSSGEEEEDHPESLEMSKKFSQSTPGNASQDQDKSKRRKSLSDASSPHHHHHKHRTSSYRRSSSSEARRMSVQRRTSRVSCGEEDQQPLEEKFSVKPALYWFLVTGRKILVKYWIWMVALMLMIMSVLGENVVVFRICYMVLFLAFLLTFQVSSV